VILLDTSGLLAWIDDRQRQHHDAVEAMRRADPPYLLSPFVLAELDYLLATRVSSEAQLALLDEVEARAYQLEAFSSADVGTARRIMAKYAELEIGLADASVVVLAERHRTYHVLTLDERHFRSLRGSRGERFRLLPADAEALR
jgi:hypothetical protein